MRHPNQARGMENKCVSPLAPWPPPELVVVVVNEQSLSPSGVNCCCGVNMIISSYRVPILLRIVSSSNSTPPRSTQRKIRGKREAPREMHLMHTHPAPQSSLSRHPQVSHHQRSQSLVTRGPSNTLSETTGGTPRMPEGRVQKYLWRGEGETRRKQL